MWSPPQNVLVPPLFDYSTLAARTRMMESPYNLLFGKMALRDLFENYFEGANRFTSRMILLKLDSLSSFMFNVAGPLDQNSGEGIIGNAEFRLESDGLHGRVIFDTCVSNTEPTLLMRSSMHIPELGVSIFWKSSPLFKKERLSGGNDSIIGFTCDSSTLLTGATFTNNMDSVFPQTAWLVSKFGVLTAGVQYEPKCIGSKGRLALPNNLENWSWAISYGQDFGTLITPSFNFGLQFVNNSQFISSFYKHMMFQRRVINPFEKKATVLITNYLDIGIEMQARMSEYKDRIRDSTIQVAASWQANKNFLLKGKMGPLSSSIALVFKSWWEPYVTFNISAIRDHIKGDTSFGLGFQVGSKHLRRYQMVSSEYARMHSKDTPNREHPVGILKWNTD